MLVSVLCHAFIGLHAGGHVDHLGLEYIPLKATLCFDTITAMTRGQKCKNMCQLNQDLPSLSEEAIDPTLTVMKV